MLLMTPSCPITTLAGAFERELAIFITLGARNEEPKPAMVKLMHNKSNISIFLSGAINLTARIPIKNEMPEIKEPSLTKS